MKPRFLGWFMLSRMLMVFAGYSAESPPNAAPPVVHGDASATNISPPVADVLRLAHSGVDDTVVIAYIDNSSSEFDLTSDNIIYLHTAGLSSADIAAMIRHDQRIHEMALTAETTSSVPPYPNDLTATP